MFGWGEGLVKSATNSDYLTYHLSDVIADLVRELIGQVRHGIAVVRRSVVLRPAEHGIDVHLYRKLFEVRSSLPVEVPASPPKLPGSVSDRN